MISYYSSLRNDTGHEQKNLVKGWYRSAGAYGTFAFGTVLRFQCIHCRKYFSTQTFSLDYYSKRTLNYRRLFDHLITTSSIRDMARDFSVSAYVRARKKQVSISARDYIRKDPLVIQADILTGINGTLNRINFVTAFNSLADEEKWADKTMADTEYLAFLKGTMGFSVENSSEHNLFRSMP